MRKTDFGNLLPRGQDIERDAIHIATAPVIAMEDLKPGDHVTFDRMDMESVCKATPGDGVGVVDPFLTTPVVKKGQRFWLFLYPNTVTGLKHHWEHPAFEKRIQLMEQMKFGPSLQRLRDFADSIQVSYSELMDRANDKAKHGEYWVEGGRWEGMGIYREFWDDYEKVTGEIVDPNERDNFFSCSC